MFCLMWTKVNQSASYTDFHHPSPNLIHIASSLFHVIQWICNKYSSFVPLFQKNHLLSSSSPTTSCTFHSMKGYCHTAIPVLNIRQYNFALETVKKAMLMSMNLTSILLSNKGKRWVSYKISLWNYLSIHIQSNTNGKTRAEATVSFCM